MSEDDLLDGAPAPDPRVRGIPVKRDGLTMWPLTNRGPAGGPHAFKIRISARRRKPPDTLHVHDGHDWMYVVVGRMRVLLGKQDLVIEPGEAVEFSNVIPHWFGAVDAAVELIAVFGPQRERTHIHQEARMVLSTSATGTSIRA